jgi:hypothetical protein
MLRRRLQRALPNIVFTNGTLTETFTNGTQFGTGSGSGTASCTVGLATKASLARPRASNQASEEALAMRNTVVLSLLLVLSGFWVQAQEGNPGRDFWVPTNTYPPTIEGCLTNANLHYTVVGKDGTVYNLTGGTARLSGYVGHEVQISGKPTVKSLDTTEKDAASTVEELPALDVKTVKELSGTCSSAPR